MALLLRAVNPPTQLSHIAAFNSSTTNDVKQVLNPVTSKEHDAEAHAENLLSGLNCQVSPVQSEI